jgi:hypothetical protein
MRAPAAIGAHDRHTDSDRSHPGWKTPRASVRQPVSILAFGGVRVALAASTDRLSKPAITSALHSKSISRTTGRSRRCCQDTRALR